MNANEIMKIDHPLTILEDELGVVAKLHPSIARAITQNRERVVPQRDAISDIPNLLEANPKHKTSLAQGHITRVSPMFMSRYGILGYAEYNVTQEVIHGIIEIAQRLVDLLKAILGRDAFKSDFQDHFFGHYWDLDKYQEKLDIPPLRDVRLIEKAYCWAVHPDPKNVSDVMEEDIHRVVSEVRDLLARLDIFIDERVHRSRPKDSNEHYRQLIEGERGIL